MDAGQQQLLIANLVASMRGVKREGILPRMLGHFQKVDAKLAEGIAEGLGTSV
jgi:catalase